MKPLFNRMHLKWKGLMPQRYSTATPSLVHRHPYPGQSSEGEDVVRCVFSISKAAF